MMTSAEIRQSFLEFFREKGHTIVPSSSLMPESPGLLFTNAGMNQFVPFFLGTQKAPYDPPRAVDTQKCIRAGGKHNDLEDVGFDTYHQTLFEMLGNWSFGEYFKKEAIAWAWELVVDRWGVPPGRVYATVYRPGEGDPGEFDQDAYDFWKGHFERAGLDPAVHVVDGGLKDNFWMMGETGPCGPCSEMHIDLTPEGNTRGALVNADDPRCIELWNLVFIQYNAEADGSFRPLPACHVDTGMGFERACSFIQCTKGFTDFSKPVSNYETDVFRPFFDVLELMSGKTYAGRLPASRENLGEQEQVDVAFRVIADHVRTLSFAIADGIIPKNEGRNYVLRRILRRAVRYGRLIGLGGGAGPFLGKLVPTLVKEFGPTFPELVGAEARIVEILGDEEILFNKTLDRGLKLFHRELEATRGDVFSGDAAFELESTYGFPVDLTELMATEHGLTVDVAQYAKRQKEHEAISAAGTGSTVVAAADREFDVDTEFVGYDADTSAARVVDVFSRGEDHFAVVDCSPLYAEKGGQVGDTGTLAAGGEEIAVIATSQIGGAFCLQVEKAPDAWAGSPLPVTLRVAEERRRDIEAHHTATHIMHWGLHEVVGADVAQQGSYVGPDRLRFDFNSKALTREQIAAVEAAANEKIVRDDPVSWAEVAHAEVAGRTDVMQFFGDKYGERVRVVQIGGDAGALNGYSMELCGGTHVRRTGEIGLFKITSESAIAAGIRRIEAVCGNHAHGHLQEVVAGLEQEIAELAERLAKANRSLAEPVPVPALEVGDAQAVAPFEPGRIQEINAALAGLRRHRGELQAAVAGAVKKGRKSASADAARRADEALAALMGAAAGDPPLIAERFRGGPALLQEMLNGLKKRQFAGVGVVVIEADDGKVHLGIYVEPSFAGRFQAGKLMGELAPLVGGKGGGKPEMARGAGSDASGIDAVLARARELVA